MIVSRRSLLRVFQVPGLLVVPLVFLTAPASEVTTVKVGMFFAGFFTIAQFSFWGNTPYVPSPLLYDGVLYLLKTNAGILSAFDAKTGKTHYGLQRLEGLAEVFASPVGAAGRVYITGRDGTTLVIRHGPAFEVLSKNTLEDGFDASPALVDRELYLRGYRFLYCIAAQ